MTSQTPRETFQHGSDCAVTFVGRADTERAFNDVWKITTHGKIFYFDMMKMRTSNGPWVFGSFSDAATGRQLWRFRNDPRAKAGFKGASFTFVHEDVTYVLFENRRDVQHVLPFVGFLLDPKTVAEVIGELRQEILQAYANQGPAQATAQMFDSSRIAALLAVRQGEQRVAPAGDQRAKETDTQLPASVPAQVQVTDEPAKVHGGFLQRAKARAGQVDEDHLWFFEHILAPMCTHQPD